MKPPVAFLALTLPLLAQPPKTARGGEVLSTGGCVSCHAQQINGIAVAAAKAVGLKTDDALEAADIRASASLRGAMQEQLFQVQDPPAGVDGMQFSLLQPAAEGVPASLATDSMIHHVAAMQRKEGDWPNYGPVRPPLEDGGFSQTARGIRTLRLCAIPGRQAEFDERVSRAAAWLEKAEPLTTEDAATQILGLAWAGNTVPAHRIQELVSKQRANGGWGQTDNLAADAYATGDVLWALHESGMAASHAVYRRGVDYLLRTQPEDGTWHVVTRACAFQPYFESDHRSHVRGKLVFLTDKFNILFYPIQQLTPNNRHASHSRPVPWTQNMKQFSRTGNTSHLAGRAKMRRRCVGGANDRSTTHDFNKIEGRAPLARISQDIRRTGERSSWARRRG